MPGGRSRSGHLYGFGGAATFVSQRRFAQCAVVRCAPSAYWPLVSLLASAPGMLVLSMDDFFDDFM